MYRSHVCPYCTVEGDVVQHPRPHASASLRHIQVEPLWADLSGGMNRLPDLADITTFISQRPRKKSQLRRTVARDNPADFKVVSGVEAERILQTVNVTPHANFQFSSPALECEDSLADPVTLSRHARPGEVRCRHGHSRTCWEMEARGGINIEGCCTLGGWMQSLADWSTTRTSGVRGRYEKDILAHAGVRLIGQNLLIDHLL